MNEPLAAHPVYFFLPSGNKPDVLFWPMIKCELRWLRSLPKQKGLMMVYNPTHHVLTRTIKVPLYYTGLNSIAKIREKEAAFKTYKLNRDYSVELNVTIPANGYTWFVIE